MPPFPFLLWVPRRRRGSIRGVLDHLEGQYQFQLMVVELMLSTPSDVKATGVQVIGTRTSGSGANPQRPRLVPGRCLMLTSGQPA